MRNASHRPPPPRPRVATSLNAAQTAHQEAVLAVQAVNTQLLEALVDAAHAADARFPLAHLLRSRFAALDTAERAAMSQCGVLLADAGFSMPHRWSGEIPERSMHRVAEEAPHWLAPERDSSLAHSTLLVAWYVVRISPAVADILLGMPRAVSVSFVKYSIRDLALIAQTHPGLIVPRWAHRTDIWDDLLALATAKKEPGRGSLTLRCLQLSADLPESNRAHSLPT